MAGDTVCTLSRKRARIGIFFANPCFLHKYKDLIFVASGRIVARPTIKERGDELLTFITFNDGQH
jgi:hypothetical protein